MAEDSVYLISADLQESIAIVGMAINMFSANSVDGLYDAIGKGINIFLTDFVNSTNNLCVDFR